MIGKFRSGQRVWVRLDGGYRIATVAKDNERTVIVSLVFGASTRSTIKRHKVKHNVQPANVEASWTDLELNAVDAMWESGGYYAEEYVQD